MTQTRKQLVDALRKLYIPARVSFVEKEFIEFEEDMASLEDLAHLIDSATEGCGIPNPHNSVLLYLTGCTDEYDATRYVDTIGGSFADIDMDLETQNFQLVMDWLVEHYGRECVANIGTIAKFKPKSTTQKFFSVTAPKSSDPDYLKKTAYHFQTQKEIVDCIPEALFGKEPTLTECVEGNRKKGWKPHPELATNPRYADWYSLAKKLEGMVSNYSIHAAGIVLSDFPITDVCPLAYKLKKDENVWRLVTQFTMDEVAELGLQKFDFLRIENLNIVKQCCLLIKERHGVLFEATGPHGIYNIPDGDQAAYDLLSSGRLGGVFQLEASKTTHDWTMRMRPQSIEELSALTSLVRPGPMSAGLTGAYLVNKAAGHAPPDLHPLFAEAFKDTYWTLTYQEQVLKLLANVAGFSLQEADNVRRAIGKKKMEQLIPAREAFVTGAVKSKVPQAYAEQYWDKTILGFADYAFAKPHAVAYSYLTYICAYLKAHYPIEFFTALMGVRSQVLQPEKWTSKAPGYAQEAKQFGISIKTPDINESTSGFTISTENDIHFGLASIRKVGTNSSERIVQSRGNKPFKDVKDFLSRIDKQKVNSGVFENLVRAGCFDSLGYDRLALYEATTTLYDWFRIVRDAEERTVTNAIRAIQNLDIKALIEERDVIRKRVKRKDYTPTQDELDFLENHKRIALHRELAIPEIPPFPVLPRHREIVLTIQDLLVQGELIGCYLPHPARLAYPATTPIGAIDKTGMYELAGTVGEIKVYKNARGNTTYLDVSDGTGNIRVPIYSNTKITAMPTKGQLIYTKAYVAVTTTIDDEDNEENIIKVKSVNNLEVHRL